MIRTKSKQVILNEILDGIVQETDIRMTGEGSVTRGIASSIASKIADVHNVLSESWDNRYLPTASGIYLDLIGEQFGLRRRPAHAPSITAKDRVIKIYVNNGTLGAVLPHPTNLNLGQIPEGSQISTSSGLIYSVDRDYDFPSSLREVYVGAVASVAGADGNVGANQLVVNSFGSGVLTTNTRAITEGKGIESDEEFKYRISKYIRSSAGSNQTAITIAALGAPGIADVKIYPYFYGPGSFKVLLIPIGNRLTEEAINVAQASIEQVIAEGVYFRISEPEYIPIALSVRLIAKAGGTVTATDRELAKNAIEEYLGNIRPGNALIINQLRSVILNSSSNISDLRIQSISINDAPVALVNYQLEKDQLFIPSEEDNGIEVS